MTDKVTDSTTSALVPFRTCTHTKRGERLSRTTLHSAGFPLSLPPFLHRGTFSLCGVWSHETFKHQGKPCSQFRSTDTEQFCSNGAETCKSHHVCVGEGPSCTQPGWIAQSWGTRAQKVPRPSKKGKEIYTGTIGKPSCSSFRFIYVYIYCF